MHNHLVKQTSLRLRSPARTALAAHVRAAYEAGATVSDLAQRIGRTNAGVRTLLAEAGTDTSRP